MMEKGLKVEFFVADDDSEAIEMQFTENKMETTITLKDLSNLNKFIIQLMDVSLSSNEEQFRREVFEKLKKSKFKV